MKRSAKLHNDATYVSAQAVQSQFPYRYYTSLPPNPKPITTQYYEPCSEFNGGCRQFYVGESTVDDYNTILSDPTRPLPRPQTELFGVAPYKARGDGHLDMPDNHSLLHLTGFNPHCSRALGEVDFDRWQCINAPNAAETTARGGVSTRFGAVYTASPQARC
jgi:hypothetical protein